MVMRLEIDAVVPSPVAVKGAVWPLDGPEAVGVTGEKVGGQDVELAENFHLEGSRKLADLGGTGRGENDLKGGHRGKFKFKLRLRWSRGVWRTIRCGMGKERGGIRSDR